jgi:hypothetical protein
VNTSLIVTAALGIAGIAGGLVGQFARRKPALRDEIRADLDIWKDLPLESAGRAGLLAHIDARLAQLTEHEDAKQPYWGGVLTGLSFALIFGAVAVYLWSLGHWWWHSASIVFWVLTATVAIAGLLDAVPAERDEKNRRIKKPRIDPSISGVSE